jgi:hypothetical protein
MAKSVRHVRSASEARPKHAHSVIAEVVMRLGKALATGIAEERPIAAEELVEPVEPTVEPTEEPRGVAVPEPEPVEVTAAR